MVPGAALFVETHRAARDVVVAVVWLVFAGEVLATYAGTVPAGASAARRLATARESLRIAAFAGNRGTADAEDRGTRGVLLAGMLAGLGIAVLIARSAPGLRLGADAWAGVVAGAAIALAGTALRAWGVLTLGRSFQRRVVVEPGQAIIRTGPYRWVRHPAYAGNVLTVLGLGVAAGSWLGGLVGALVALAAHLPRIRVEEHALAEAFGPAYDAYARATARLVPGVW